VRARMVLGLLGHVGVLCVVPVFVLAGTFSYIPRGGECRAPPPRHSLPAFPSRMNFWRCRAALAPPPFAPSVPLSPSSLWCAAGAAGEPDQPWVWVAMLSTIAVSGVMSARPRPSPLLSIARARACLRRADAGRLPAALRRLTVCDRRRHCRPGPRSPPACSSPRCSGAINGGLQPAAVTQP
jgi:hypothetical protein